MQTCFCSSDVQLGDRTRVRSVVAHRSGRDRGSKRSNATTERMGGPRDLARRGIDAGGGRASPAAAARSRCRRPGNDADPDRTVEVLLDEAGWLAAPR